MRKKQLIAGMLVAMVFGQSVGGSSPITVGAAEENTISDEVTFNKEGLWLTEIYQNDVDRSQVNNKREQNGYESINLYTDTADLMEFIEITSTYSEAINLNDIYEIYYNDTLLTITDINGNADITIQPGQSIVIWNYRSDITTEIPTEEEFRKNMRIPDDAVVLKATCNINWATTATFSLKTKSDNKTVSTFTATDKIDTADGFSVELKIPDIGSKMQVYREMTTPSAGYVYSAQLNGLAQTKIPDAVYAEGVYITEIRSNDTNRNSVYGIEDDLMECVEIVNTTDSDVDLNNEYQLMYFVKEGSRKLLTMYHYDETSESHIGTSENCIIPAGGTAVIWCYRQETLSGYTSFPTEQEFRDAYGIGDDIPVYIFNNQNGLNNSNRGFELYKLQEDGTKELVSNYCYVGNSDLKDNKSVDLAVNPEGPEMIAYTKNATTSMGTVNPIQYTYLKDDGSALTLRLNDEVPESIMQGEEIRVNFYFDVTSKILPRTGITTYYRFDGEGEWYSTTETSRRVPNLYEANISADQLFSHDYVEFYVSADNRYRSTLSDIYKVKINKLNNVDGIRTNISNGEEVSGTVSITANDGGNNSTSEIYIDGVNYSTVPMLEDGAYFSFSASGRDSYFKNAITTTNNEIIAYIGKWQYCILDGQALRIDNNYFTYNQETNSYDVTLRFWAGTYGVTVDEYLLPTANREDFTVTELALKLINGNVYYPTSIGPNDETTSTKTNLSTDYNAVHSIGDSTGMCPYMDVSFSVPASEVTAVGTEIDTTALSEGEHTLKVTNGTSTKEVTFIVDNTAPIIDLDIQDGSELTGKITLNPQITETNSLKNVIITLDGEQINTTYETTAYNLGDGEHTVVVFAEDEAGNTSTKTATFTVSDASITITHAGAMNITDSSATLYLTLQNSVSDTQATFYKTQKIDTSNITTNTADGILPYIQYTVNVGNVNDDDVIIASWNGTASNTDNTHASKIYVLNTENGEWDTVATADENGSIEASFAVKNHVKDGIATVIVQCTADSALPDLDTVTDGELNTNENWDGTTVPEDYDFCIAWETDTQYYAEEWQYHFLNMNQWIVDNAEDWNIKYVIHTGDIVDDYDMIYQWENADEAMSIFDEAGMPYGVLGGNHDLAAGLEYNDNYYTYFGEDRFVSQPTYGGSYQNNLGHYDLISENGQDLIIVYMSWNVYQEEIDWLNDVLQQYSDRKAILCFHPYTNVKYSSGTLLDYFGELIQKEVVEKNPNVFAVLNGHYHGSSYETVMFDDNGDGVNDRTVYQICTDYQSGFEGGSEYIKFLYFDLDNNKIYMNSYSPYLNDFNYYDTDLAVLNIEGASATGVDKMVLDVEFNTNQQSILEEQFSAYLCTNEKFGTADVNKNIGIVTLDVDNLDAETEYVWYAVVANENTGYLKTGLYEFTTEKKQETDIPSDSDKDDTDAPSDSDKDDTDTPSDSDKDDTDTPSNSDKENTDTPSNSNKEDSSSIGTGDKFSLGLLGLLGASTVVIGGTAVLKKRKKED